MALLTTVHDIQTTIRDKKMPENYRPGTVSRAGFVEIFCHTAGSTQSLKLVLEVKTHQHEYYEYSG
eukprot:6785156-Pyramimonas_sp.AAC.1